MESPSLERVKRSVDVALGHMVSSGAGCAELMLGLSDLSGLFQPKQLYDSMIYKIRVKDQELGRKMIIRERQEKSSERHQGSE